jgi:hypothetical protein
MFEGLKQRSLRLARSAAERRRASIAEAMRSALGPTRVVETPDGVSISARDLKRRAALDPELRTALARLR